MNTAFSSEWSREEKEEYATKRMNEMKLKNEKFKQRHAEVEKDRIEAEQKCSAVTLTAKVPPKAFKEVEEEPASQPERRKEREWDIGKASDGDWSPNIQQQGFRRSRPPRRGVAGYFDGRRDRKDSNWRVREDYDRKDSHQSFDFNKRSGNFRGNGNSRYPTSYQRSRGRSGYKNTELPYKSSHNWTDETKKNFSSGSSHLPFAGPANEPRKTSTKLDSDKVWHDDGLNEVQNKQSRVEKWVKSLSSVEDWSESEEKPNKSYSSSGRGKGSGSHDTPQCNWADDENEDSGAKNQPFFVNRGGKYERKYDHSSQKITVNYGEKIHVNNVLTSTVTHPEGGRAVCNRTVQKLQSSRQKLRVSSDENSSNSKESDHRSCRRGHFSKQKFDQRAPNYGMEETTGSKSQAGTNQHGYDKRRDKYLPSANSGTWGNLKTDNPKLKANKSTWSDEGGDDQLDNKKSTLVETGGTWSDVEDSNQNISSHRKRDSGCKWDDEQRGMDGIKNHSEKWGEQKPYSGRSGDYRQRNPSSLNNARFNQRNVRSKPEFRQNSDYRKAKHCQNVKESAGTWSDQEDDRKVESEWKSSKEHTESGPGFYRKSNYQKKNQSQNKESTGTWSDQEDSQVECEWKSGKGQARSRPGLHQSRGYQNEHQSQNKKSTGTWSDQEDGKAECEWKSSKAQTKSRLELHQSSDYQNEHRSQNKKSTGTWSDQEDDGKVECKLTDDLKADIHSKRNEYGTWNKAKDENLINVKSEKESINEKNYVKDINNERGKYESGNMDMEPGNSNLAILKEESNNTIDVVAPISVRTESGLLLTDLTKSGTEVFVESDTEHSILHFSETGEVVMQLGSGSCVYIVESLVPNEFKADSDIKCTNNSEILLQNKSIEQCIHIPECINSELSTEDAPLIEEKPICVIQDVYSCSKFSDNTENRQSCMNDEQIIDEKPLCATQDVFSYNELSSDINSKSDRHSSSPNNIVGVLQKGVEDGNPSVHPDAVSSECSKELETQISALHLSADSDGSTEWSTVTEENDSEAEQLNKVNG